MDRKRAGDFLGGHMGDRKTEKRGRVETNVDEQMKNPVVQEAPSSELSTMLTVCVKMMN